LETSAKAYLKHEKDVFKLLTEARKSVTKAVETGDLKAMSQAMDQVSQLLPKLR